MYVPKRLIVTENLYIMPYISRKLVQQRVITEMVDFCGLDCGFESGMSVRRAAGIVSGENDPAGPRQSDQAFSKISAKTVTRWYYIYIHLAV